jgi:hypothetical protein
MKKTSNMGGAATFSLADFPSGEQMHLEEEIMRHALALWRKKGHPCISAFEVLRRAARRTSTRGRLGVSTPG